MAPKRSQESGRHARLALVPASEQELIATVERIEALSHDLARDLWRDHHQVPDIHRAMIEAIRQDVDAVHLALTRG